MLIGVGLALVAPWPLKLIVDYVLPNKPLPPVVAWLTWLPAAATPRGLLLWLSAATVGLFLLRRVTSIAQSYVQAGTGSRMVYDLAGDVFLDLQRRSLLFHGRRQLGDLVRRVTADTSCVRELVLHVYLPLLTCAATICSTFFVMWQLSRPLAIFAVVLTLPLALIVRLFARPMTERKYKEWEVQGEIASLAEQTLTALPVVQAFGRENCENRRFHHLAGKTVQATLRSEMSQHQFRVSTGAVNTLAGAAVMTAGGIAVLQGRLSVGSLLVLVSYFAALYSPIETLAYLSEGFASAAAGARRVLELLDSHEFDIVDQPEATPLCATSVGRGITVRFSNVIFGYEPGRPVIHDVSLVARSGEILALVGSTGAGKSTLVSLLLRFFDPWQGSLYFNDRDFRSITLSSLREQIAIVPQQAFLLPLTIAENIAYARPEATREEIQAAAIAASADTFIQRLPQGYDTVIGERGATLSGGERQRLSIARAILKDAPILILDEPTSAVDAETEAGLMEALAYLMQGRTTFIIAHRLSTIRRANQILVIENGRCMECGKHDELLSLRGHYYQFHETQLAKPVKAKIPAMAQRIA
jgi:ATP-binding cassette subfamily B protein/subfamily B ATP-binding cassette protein MsbA